MTSAWDKFQRLMREKMREVYSETYIDHNLDPKNVGSIENADGHAEVNGTCGDMMEMWLKVDGDIIVDAGFTTTGCGAMVASGSLVTEIVKGKTLSEAQQIEQQDILDTFGGLPEENQNCALIAADTLKAAIRDCLQFQREPWKKLYKKH
jgi:NifU-like protein involved in Fe-S cluster formation